MPPLSTKLRVQLLEAIDIAMMGERLRSNTEIGEAVRRELTVHRRTLLYELAYLRAFNQWEVFLEEVCLRYMCGYAFMGVQETPLVGFSTSLGAARAVLYGSKMYLLWHNPRHVCDRADNHFVSGNRLASVIGSAFTDMQDYATIRHRIAHDHIDARRKFDTSCMRLAARRLPGSRPGAFLRLPTLHGGVPVSWLERICKEMSSLAAQLAP
jgi:hypothetical protein